MVERGKHFASLFYYNQLKIKNIKNIITFKEKKDGRFYFMQAAKMQTQNELRAVFNQAGRNASLFY
jgi:hypothetical protein